jgi:inorganic triphosphatase YgiF
LSNAKDSLSRSEWEWELEDRQPDLTHLHATPLHELAGTAVQPIFTSDVTRTIHHLCVADGLVEMATDLGWLRAGEQVEPIREVELELKEGRPAALFAIATSLQSTMLLLLSTESKARRGWRLATGSPHGLDNAAVPSVRSDVSGLEAFRDLVSTMLARLIESQPAASTGSMEGVHQMRIAIRRLRALLALFRPYLAREEEFGFTETLRQLGRILGEARDWDVFCTKTLIEAKNEGVPASLLQALWRAAEVERRAAHARLARELEQPPLTPMVLSLLA